VSSTKCPYQPSCDLSTSLGGKWPLDNKFSHCYQYCNKNYPRPSSQRTEKIFL